MNSPRLLAVGDVHLTAPFGGRDAVQEFYQGLLGFDCLEVESDSPSIVLVGTPRSGPRLIIDLLERPPAKPMRRHALIQVTSLAAVSEALLQERIPFEWASGWFFFDRRMGLPDPAGNWIELTSSHPF